VLTEAEAIPYEPTLLRGERLLVLAPHPDDEVIGCGGLVALHLRESRAVRIVIATDGAQAGDAATREEESRRAIVTLGRAEVEFLRFPDRTLGHDAAPRLREQLLAFRPDLILVPSLDEIHPDHLALARALIGLIQSDETLFADLAVARVAFYEVSQPVQRPNAIVDISEVADAKYAAIAEHASQLAFRDYVSYARGLNAYRAMTLPPGTRYAEAYRVVELPSLRTMPASQLGASVEVTRETLPISVVIRTKDRPAQLREAVASVRATEYPCEVVVVNDGGAAVEIDGAKVVTHEQSRGRSEAANAGVRAASNAYVAFLDDDDLYYPEHLATLANAARAATSHVAWYSDTVSAFLRPGAGGGYETRTRMRLFAQDYDRELLLVDNYIPLPALLVARDTFLGVGGFDPAFDLFEDWDFLIRLSQRGTFVRVPRVTCEIRHFEGGSSVVLAAPEGSERFRNAKLQVWRKHEALLTPDVFANVLARQKQRMNALYSDTVEAKGLADDAQRNASRSLRESIEMQNTLNGYRLRVRELEGSLAALQGLVPALTEKSAEVERLKFEREQHNVEREQLHAAQRDAASEIESLRVEIARLNGLLDMIYRSKTWKLHTLVEKARGRG
jgi:LmbE family N-acetylglucosaminyl deacetylase/glycosyltransferase involved in cell wall biosynthesis